MKKRILSILLAAVMLLTLVPVTVFAATTTNVHVRVDNETIDKLANATVKFIVDDNTYSATTNSNGLARVTIPTDDIVVGIWEVSCPGYVTASREGMSAEDTPIEFRLVPNQPTTYAITNGTAEGDKETNHGYITIDKETAAENATVTVTVKPNEGYQLKTLQYNDGTDHEITADAQGAYKFTMPAKAVTVTATFEATAAPGGTETELFDPSNGAVDYTVGINDSPVATWNAETKTLTTEIKANGYDETDNQVFFNTGVTALDTTKEYQISFTATASTDNCDNVSFIAFIDNTIVVADQNITLSTTPYDYVSAWAKPSSTTTSGRLNWVFGSNDIQTVTITNISIKERTTEAPAVEVTTWGALQDAINNAPDNTETTIQLTQDLTAPATGTSITIPEGKDITLDLNGHVINANGGNFSVIKTDGKLTLIDSAPTTEHKGYVDANGLWHLGTPQSGETVKNIKGGVITGGNISGGNGGGVYVDGGIFTMESGNIAVNKVEKSGTSAVYGGGVYVNNGTFNMNGGDITDNTASSGGGVHVYTGIFTMSGGTITGNTAANYGGGVDLNVNAEFTMSENGKIAYNTGKSGGGVYVGGTFNMKGGSIDHNTATAYGGGVLVGAGAVAELTLGGTAKITDNVLNGTIQGGKLTGGTANNVFLANNKNIITLGTGTDAPKDDMSVGVTMATPGKFTGTATDTQTGYFSSDNSGYEVAFKTDHLELKVISSGVSTWSALQDAIDKATASPTTIQLTQDLTAPATGTSITIPNGKNITLDLNGRVINANGGAFNVITVEAGGKLTLIDSKPTTEHKGYIDADGLWHLGEIPQGAEGCTEKTVLGGVITGGTGKVCDEEEGTSINGGGVYVSGTLNMNGGNIVGNKVTPSDYGASGGGVYNSGTFTMSGGEITGNTATKGVGGGVCNSGKFTMTGGEITGNTASASGGVYNSGTFAMTGGEISGNEAAGYGGGVYNRGTVTLNGTAKITGNDAEYGGGVYNIGTFTMADGTISENTANYGGGVDIEGGTFTMTGGNIVGNKATPSGYGGTGGGVYNYYATFTMTDGAVSGNEANFGGGVCNYGTFTMADGTISENTAVQKGGGVYNNGTLTLGGTAKITGNTLSDGTTANNLYLLNGKKVTLGTGTGESGNGVAAPVTGMSVGVTMATPGTFTGTATETQKGYFSSDNSGYEVAFNTNHLELKEISRIPVTFDVNAKPVNGGKAITYGTTYTVTAPTVSDANGALDPQPEMTFTYYKSDGQGGWTVLKATPTDAGSYKVVIAVKDDNATYTGSMEKTFDIAKADAEAPAAGEGYTIDYANIKLTVLEGYELNGMTDDFWFNSKVVPGPVLAPNYTYQVRRAADDNHNASTPTSFTTPALPATPTDMTVLSKSSSTIVMDAGSGLEYSVNSGTTWVDDASDGTTDGKVTITGLAANTTYSIIARVKATDSAFASGNSEVLRVNTKISEDSKMLINQVSVDSGKIVCGGSAVDVKTASGTDIPADKLNDVASATNAVLNNKAVASYTDIGLEEATKDSNDSIVEDLKAETYDDIAKGNVNETDISKYLNVKLVSATVDTDETVTVTAMTFDVTPMATITVKDSNNEDVVLTTEIKDYVDGEVTFLLPVASATDAETAAVYHEGEFIGNKTINADGTIEVTTTSFSEFSYILLDWTTAGAVIDDEVLYASLADAVSKVTDNQTITLLKDASGAITVSRGVKFAIDNNGKSNTATIVAGEGYTVSQSGNTYSVTVKSSGGHHYSGGTVVQSGKTGDMGIVLYGVLAISSVLGMGWVGKRKHDEV